MQQEAEQRQQARRREEAAPRELRPRKFTTTPRCGFCGGVMEPEDAFCVECGGPIAGKPCPKCGTVSHRSFCPNCNAPLDALAMQAIAEAQRDPRFTRACQLAKELAEIEDAIAQMDEEAVEEAGEGPVAAALDEKDRQMAMRYQQLFAAMKIQVSEQTAERREEKAPKVVKKNAPIQFSFGTCDAKKAVEIYKEKVNELNETLASMIPDPADPVELQRNYLSARKMPVYTTKVVRNVQGWVCNYCGCTHQQPSECTRPELGGQWIYQESTIVTKRYE